MLDFEAILSPLPISLFIKEIMGQRHHLARGEGRCFGDLMTWELLSEALLTHRFDYPRLRLVKEGRTLPPDEFMEAQATRRGEYLRRQNASAVEGLMRAGAMLHLAAADELSPRLSYLAASAESVFGSTCFVNIHAGLHNSRGFDTHWDGHEVCVLQVQGRKHWRVLGITEKAPLAVPPAQKGSPPEDLLWEGALEAGDLLYLPRGCWHSAVALDGPTLHLSLGWENPNGADFLRWLVANRREELWLRYDGPTLQQLDQVSAYTSDLRNRFDDSDWPDAYAAFLSERRAAAQKRRQRITLP